MLFIHTHTVGVGENLLFLASLLKKKMSDLHGKPTNYSHVRQGSRWRLWLILQNFRPDFPVLRISHSINQTHTGTSDVKTKRSHLQKTSETKKLDSSVGSQYEDHPSPSPLPFIALTENTPSLQETAFHMCLSISSDHFFLSLVHIETKS